MKKNTFFFVLLMSVFSISIFMSSCNKGETLGPQIETAASVEKVSQQELQDHNSLNNNARAAQIPPTLDWQQVLIGKGATLCTFPPCPCTAPFGFCSNAPWIPWLEGDEVLPGQTLTNVKVESNQLRLEFLSPPQDVLLVIPNDATLSAEVSELLGFSSIRIVPGEYTIDFSNTEFGEAYLEFTD